MNRSPNVVQKILLLLTPKERRQVYFLLPIIIVMALLQVVGIASILPFLQLAGDPDRLHNNSILSWAYNTLGFQNETGFLFFLGVLAFLTLAFSNGFSAYTTWKIDKFSFMQSHRLSMRLLENYLYKPYVFFLNRNTSDLCKRILAEVQQVVSGILMPGLQMIAQALATIFILAFLVVYDPILAVAAAIVLGGAYMAIYIRVRRKVTQIGKENVVANRYRYQYTYEALNGIKEAKILGKEPSFLAQYAAPSEKEARNNALNHIISAIPRYALEVIAFGGILLIVLYLLAIQQDLGQILPVIGVYAFASYRLMPALQKIFSTITKIRFHVAALNSLYEDAQDSRLKTLDQHRKSQQLDPMPFRDRLELQNVSFRYPGAQNPVLKNLNLTIKAKTSVAFVGATGSGKTTTVDIILGLLKPNEGALVVDGVVVDDENLAAWQRNLGYVPQHIYLSDASVARNIAFGVPEEQIDMAAVERAARIANLHDFIVKNLPDGYKTVVGERGVRLSGGQRQRIGIARALYHDPEVLILDEATSALDGITEESVFEAVEAIAETKTVIMIAHRMNTIRNCDVIYMLENGHVVSQGSYQELLNTNIQFHAMAKGGAQSSGMPAAG